MQDMELFSKLIDRIEDLYERDFQKTERIAALEKKLQEVERRASFAYNRTAPVGQIGAGGSSDKIY